MSSEEFDQCKFILIRHGLSQFNYKALVASTEYGLDSQEFRAVETDTDGIDPELHPVGIAQCEVAHPVVNSINFKVVFTSPMQRAMQTVIHMFKSHPNKDNIKFVVLPIIREVLHTVCDIAMDSDDLMKKFADGEPGNFGIKFDFSRFSLYGVPQLWQVSTLANVKLQQVILEQLEDENTP